MIFGIYEYIAELFNWSDHRTLPKEGQVFYKKNFGMTGALLFIALFSTGIITLYLEKSLWVPLCLFLFSLIGAVMMIAFVNCRIFYDDEGFVVKNFWGIRKRFAYNQVSSISKNMESICLYVEKRKVNINEFMVGGEEFTEFVRKKYRILHNGKASIKVNRKKDIFNDNVLCPKETIFVIITFFLVIVIMMIAVVWEGFVEQSDINNTIGQSAVFESCNMSEKGKECVLKSTDGKIYIIEHTDKQFNQKGIASICNGIKSVTTYSEQINSRKRGVYYSVKAIVYNGDYVLTFEETNRLQHQKAWINLIWVVGFMLLWLSISTMRIIVGRNPHRFSETFVRLFFWKGSIKY